MIEHWDGTGWCVTPGPIPPADGDYYLDGVAADAPIDVWAVGTSIGRSRLYFAGTGHSLSGGFLTYWKTHHGPVVLEVPISEVVAEGNGDGSGRRYPLHWFENGRLEYHPEAAHTRYAFELGLLGLQALRAGVGP